MQVERILSVNSLHALPFIERTKGQVELRFENSLYVGG